MKPTETIEKEVKDKNGIDIIIKMETFKESVGKNADGDYFNTQSFFKKEDNSLIGKLMFPKANKETLEKQMDIAINNIDQYLDVISKV